MPKVKEPDQLIHDTRREDLKRLTLRAHQERLRYALRPFIDHKDIEQGAHHVKDEETALHRLNPNLAPTPKEAERIGLVKVKPPQPPLFENPADTSKFREMSNEQQRQAVLEFLHRWYQREPEGETLDDTLKQRVAAAYRIVREMARLRGFLRADQLLVEGLGSSSFDDETAALDDRWRVPKTIPTQPDAFASFLQNLDTRDAPAYSDVTQSFLHGQHLGPASRISFKATQEYRPPQDPALKEPTPPPRRVEFDGFALLPPSPPFFFTDRITGGIMGDYDPDADKLLGEYIRCLRLTANRLGVYEGTLVEPDAGIVGMELLTDPRTVRAAFPTPEMLIAWEIILVEEAMELVITQGRHKAQHSLRQTHGLRLHEALGLIRMAMSETVRRNLFNSEEEKAMMLMVLDDHRKRAREACDLRVELQNIKATVVVQGLARVAPEDSLSMFVNAVKSVAREREMAQNKELPALGTFAGNTVIDAPGDGD